jgi:hypothetical protein
MRSLVCAAVWAVATLALPIAQARRAPEPAALLRHQLAAPADLPKSTVPGAEPNEAELLSHRHYKTKDGQEVHSPRGRRTIRLRSAQVRSAGTVRTALVRTGGAHVHTMLE